MFGMNRYVFLTLFSVVLILQCVNAPAQSVDRGSGYVSGSSVVGGVEVDAFGILKTAPKSSLENAGKTLKQLVNKQIPADLAENSPIRKISLKKLNESISRTLESRGEFSDAARYLGGLTSIRYIVVVPEENDVVLVGTSEPWKVDDFGNVVGKNSGKPVFLLEDLLTVYRSLYKSKTPSVITCSIDPTPEALVKISQVGKKFPVADSRNAAALAAAYEDAYGMNVVTINGVPATSRFAKVLAACDYKMKRIGLEQEPSGVRGLPSYISMVSGSQKQINPRFWLAPEYGEISHDSKKLTWQLSEVKVKALTEDQYVDTRNGALSNSGRTDSIAAGWCSKMSKNYEQLSKVDPVFGDLKNCMELAIAVALIRSENLLETANCKLTAFDNDTLLKAVSYPEPKSVPSKATISRNGRTTIVACGGVEINPFTTVQSAKLDSKIDSEYKTLSKTEGKEWWSK
ncbi:hypothetical protein FACS189427_00990 [Planctomycetales bacterium]|nr:hypothetical protein FACS189427_00990 [Planctomycetales bacterium]